MNNQNNDSIFKTVQSLRWDVGDDLHDTLINRLYSDAGEIADAVVTMPGKKERLTWFRTLYYNRSDINRPSNYKQGGFSVRCVRD